jgi:transposase
MKIFAGLDVHSKQCTYAIEDAAGRVLSRGEFATTPDGIAEWVKRHGLDAQSTIGMESGTVSPFVARALKAHGIDKVLIINAAEVRAKESRPTQKSDTSDAFEICEGVRRGIYSAIVELPDAPTQALRDRLATRRHFVVAMTREVNAIKGELRKRGLGHIYRTMKCEKAFTKLLSQPQIDGELKAKIEAHQRLWSAAKKEVEALDAELEQVQEVMSAEVERLRTVPGVGPIVALTTLAYLARPARFKNAKHAASYTGLVPQTYNSADRECYGHITKAGPRELRAMLCESAQHAAKKNHPLHSLYLKVRNKKGHNVAIIAVAHRLARILWSMMKNQTPFDAARYQKMSPQWEKLCESQDNTVPAAEVAVVH